MSLPTPVPSANWVPEPSIGRAERAARFQQKPVTLWLTGLSASGKSTLAFTLERQLFTMGAMVFWLDGDTVRKGLCSDLGFTAASRHENIRRMAEVARIFNEAGLIVIAALISPLMADRQMAREIIGDANFLEVFVKAPLSTCEARDPKGLYKKARQGQIPNFTGIDAPYEEPLAPDLTVASDAQTPTQNAVLLVNLLRQRGCLPPAV